MRNFIDWIESMMQCACFNSTSMSLRFCPDWTFSLSFVLGLLLHRDAVVQSRYTMLLSHSHTGVASLTAT